MGLSRVWVEEPLAPDLDNNAPTTSWLDNLNRDPNVPDVRTLAGVEGHFDPVGHRVVVLGRTITSDLRAVSPVRIYDSGETVIAVMAERDWYRWSEAHYGDTPHASLRWIPAARVYIE